MAPDIISNGDDAPVREERSLLDLTKEEPGATGPTGDPLYNQGTTMALPSIETVLRSAGAPPGHDDMTRPWTNPHDEVFHATRSRHQ